MKKYEIYYAGGERITTIQTSSIKEACNQFICTLQKPAKYKLTNSKMASIRYKDNYSICGDFVVLEK